MVHIGVFHYFFETYLVSQIFFSFVLVEINPFAQLADGKVMCLDAKFNFDANALFRHPEFTVLKYLLLPLLIFRFVNLFLSLFKFFLS